MIEDPAPGSRAMIGNVFDQVLAGIGVGHGKEMPERSRARHEQRGLLRRGRKALREAIAGGQDCRRKYRQDGESGHESRL